MRRTEQGSAGAFRPGRGTAGRGEFPELVEREREPELGHRVVESTRRSDDTAALRHLARVFSADDPLLRRVMRADRLLSAPERSAAFRQVVDRYFAGAPRVAGS